MKASLGTMLVLALSVAQAYGAEAGTCVKSAKVEGRYHGAYLDAACTKPASEAQQAAGRQNKFTWQSLAPPLAFTTSKTGTVQVLTSAGTEIECNSQHFVSKAEWLDGVEGIHTIGFYCSIQHGFELRRQKYWESRTVFRTTFEGPSGQVWERYEAQPAGQPVFEGESETGRIVRLVGSFSGVLAKPDRMTTKFSLNVGTGYCPIKCEAGEAPQSLALEMSTDGGATWSSEPAIMRYEFNTRAPAKVELRSA